jgi:hypothetical protein
VKISGVSLRAIQRSAGRSSRRPPRMIAMMTPIALAGADPAGAVVVLGHRAEQRQQREQRNRRDVLQQRDADDALPGRGRAQVAFAEHAERDRRRRQGEAECGHQREPPLDAAEQRDRCEHDDRAEQLHAAPAEDRLPQGPEAVRLELHADQEQHQHHARIRRSAACPAGR